MRTSFVRYVSPTPHHTSFRKERAIVGAARGRSASAIPDLELIHPGVSDLDRETPFGNSTRILSVVVAHLHCAASSTRGSPVTETRFHEFAWRPRHLAPALLGAQLRCLALGVERRAPRHEQGGAAQICVETDSRRALGVLRGHSAPHGKGWPSWRSLARPDSGLYAVA